MTKASRTGAHTATRTLDDLILAIAADRDRDAFAQLFSYYAPRLKSFLMRGGTSPETAEELAQEAMLSVWRKAARFDPRKASAGTWIFAIARNLRIDRLRRESRPELDPNDPALVPDEPGPEKGAEAAQTQRHIRTAIEALPEEQAKVVQLSYFEELTHSEIATALHLPLGTVKSRLRLALGRIRQTMKET